MSIARASRVRNEMCYLQLCIDQYDDGEIRGRLFNAYYADALFFDSCMDMVRQIEDVFNHFDYPHATMDLRSFETEEEKAERTENTPTVRLKQAPAKEMYVHDVKGKLATLKMRVMFRQNASWQGTLKWMEEGLQENFQSVLELLLLIDSVFTDE